MNDLLPCPFCGMSLVHVPDFEIEIYEHPKTGDCILDGHTVYIDTPGDITTWNRRHKEDEEEAERVREVERARIVAIIERELAEMEGALVECCQAIAKRIEEGA
jgi:Zn-finger nucleic acid-binding protein